MLHHMFHGLHFSHFAETQIFYNIWYQGQKVIKMYVYIQFFDFGTCKIWECSHFSKKNERNSNVFRISRARNAKKSVGIIVDNTKVKRSKNAWYQGQKVIKCMFTYNFMTLGPAKHEKRQKNILWIQRQDLRYNYYRRKRISLYKSNKIYNYI